MQDPLAEIAGVPPFSDFAPEEREDILRRTQYRSYRADETIFREGDPPAFVYYIVSGEVILTLTSEDRRISVGRFTAGRLVGIHTLFDDGPQFVTAAAVTPATLLAIPRDALLGALRRHPEAIFHVTSVFARQIRAAALGVAEMQFLELPVRLARRILDLADQPSVRRDARGHLLIKVTQKELSELTGATRGGVNRALRRLEQTGIVRTNRGMLTVLAPDRLRNLARHETLPMILGLVPAR